MDKIEEYIRKTRDDLDIYKPSPVLWKKIKKNLNTGRETGRRWISIAAGIAVILTTSVIFYQIGRRSNKTDGFSIKEGETISSKLQLKEAEVFYDNQVNLLYLEAKPLLIGNPELEHEFNSEISQIDSIYADLKKDLKDNIANQEVVEALIQNYVIKIKILEDMLTVLRENENNGKKKKSYEL
jgi:hypothetical protein